MELLSVAIKAIFIENILLSFFLGMCSFLACSKKLDTAIGLGFAVVFVMAVTTPLNWLLNEFLLKDGALAWAGFPTVNLSFLQFICFISTIAAVTQLVEMVMDKFTPALYQALGIFLPLIAVNCAILGASLFMVGVKNYDLAESSVFGIAAGVGWMLAIVSLAAIRKKLQYSNVPLGLRGLGIAMMMTGLMALGFMSFIGITL
jgi:Na+-transporting NADH:ubiquinone oxidoreductase subunit E